MAKITSLRKRLQDIERELESLKLFRITTQLRKFQRALVGEQSFVKNEIAKITATIEEKAKISDELLIKANMNRSEKMKRTWRYLKAIQKNYDTKMSLRELRTALKKHRQGLETDIPDVAWRNPSP